MLYYCKKRTLTHWGSTCAAHPHRVLLLQQVHLKCPDFDPSQKCAAGEQTLWQKKKGTNTASSPKHQRNQEHNTMGTHFIISARALRPLRPSAVPTKYIRRGARRGRTHPNNNTTYPLQALQNSQVLPHFIVGRCHQVHELCAKARHQYQSGDEVQDSP